MAELLTDYIDKLKLVDEEVLLDFDEVVNPENECEPMVSQDIVDESEPIDSQDTHFCNYIIFQLVQELTLIFTNFYLESHIKASILLMQQ